MSWLKAKWRQFYNTFISLQGSPESIARSFSLGFAIAWWPIIGTHSILSLLGGLLFRGNLPAVYLSSWLCNPITIPFILMADYKVGDWLVGAPDLLGANFAQMTFREMLALGWHVLVPMMVGGLLLGGINAALGYFPVKYYVICFRRRGTAPKPKESPR